MVDLTDECFDTNDFAEPATYTNTLGASNPIDVIFDREFALQNIGDVTIQNAKPSALCKSADVPNAELETNAFIVVRGVNYSIIEAHPEASGTTLLLLTKV